MRIAFQSVLICVMSELAMLEVSLAGVASYLPDTVVRNDFFASSEGGRKSPMYHAPSERRHVAPGESSAAMIEHAAARLLDELNVDRTRDVEIVITNVSLPDQVFTGCGAEVAHRLGLSPTWVFDLHNTGCISFVYMIELARMVMQARGCKSALICNAQTAAGRVFSQQRNRDKPQSAIPGDAAGVAYLVASDESPVLAISQRCFGEFAGDMTSSGDDGRQFWEPGSSSLNINFNQARIAKIMARGNRLVPTIVKDACEQAGVEPGEIDRLITNQPNPIFLRNWREALGLEKEQHPDTFDRYGNLFGAGIPVTLDETIADGNLKSGDLLALGGFSHAGDYAAAALVRWRARG